RPRRDAARKPTSQVRKRQTEARAQDHARLFRKHWQARKIGEDKGSEASQSTWRRDQETKLASQAPYLSQSKVRGRNLPNRGITEDYHEQDGPARVTYGVPGTCTAITAQVIAWCF